MIDVTNFTKTCNCCGANLTLEFYIPWNKHTYNAVQGGQQGVALVHCKNKTCDLYTFSVPLDEYDSLFAPENANRLEAAKLTVTTNVARRAVS